MKTQETRIKCERCEKSIDCLNLKSCLAFSPALNSNFEISVEIDRAAGISDLELNAS